MRLVIANIVLLGVPPATGATRGRRLGRSSVTCRGLFEVARRLATEFRRLLGRPKGGGRRDLRHDRRAEAAVLFPSFLGGQRGAPLGLVVIEDRRAVLAAPIRELPVFGGRIDVVPEDVQQVLVTDLCRIVKHLNRFRVPGFSSPHLMVSRMWLGPPR